MCGIAGQFAPQGTEADLELVRRMTRLQTHRGPDDEGIFHEPGIALGHRRLSIIDLSAAGHQPMCSRDGRFTVTYNGEIYNYLELRAELAGHGHNFVTSSDTEVLLAAYAEWGEACVERFLGMWAFGLWDRRERTLFLARDPFGIKPLFYCEQGARLCFASEVQALLLAGPEMREPNWPFLARQLTERRFARQTETSFRRISALQAGTTLTLGPLGRRSRRYWNPDLTELRERFRAQQDSGAAFRELFTDAVRLHFRSDVPVGVCLSGGLDSSAIVAVATRILGSTLRTFSIDYPDWPGSEGRFIHAMNTQFQCIPTIGTPAGETDFVTTTEAMIAAHGEPDQGIGVYSQWKVMELASGHVKVLLDGQGGDELLGGYPFLVRAHLADLVRRVRWATAWSEFRAYRDVAPDGFGLGVLEEILPGLARRLDQARGDRATRRLLEVIEPGIRSGAWDPSAVRDGILAPPPLLEGPVAAPDGLTARQYRTIRADLLPSLLYFEDRNSMAFSLESRVPFLDRRLVEYCLGLPAERRISRGSTKVVLREAMAGLLPDEVRLRRDKKGFPTPFARWLRGPLSDAVAEVLLDQRVLQRGLLSPVVMERRIKAHREGRGEHSAEIYNWLQLELWFRQFHDSVLA
jgi:asparagine synthase (glutamine-hydrolysing)